jgi:translation initiation factor 2B subunit (eIF-2B alpha/beta/delta family)
LSNVATNGAVARLVDRIQRDAIGGAADMAKETAAALAEEIGESAAPATGELRSECIDAFERIIAVTPSVMPVTFVLHLVGSELERSAHASLEELRDRLITAANAAQTRIAQAVEGVAAGGADLLADGEVLFTYSISSTVFAILREVRRAGKRVSVVTTESRPGNEGLRTLDVLQELGVPVTIGIDAALATLMRTCTSVCVGGDTITATGDALCKIGSFPAALAARHYGIPFRVAADVSKFDPNTLRGIPLLVREMPATDIVPGEKPVGTTVRNPVFEVVPGRYIDAIITDAGVVAPAAAYALMSELPRCSLVAERVASLYRDATIGRAAS